MFNLSRIKGYNPKVSIISTTDKTTVTISIKKQDNPRNYQEAKEMIDFDVTGHIIKERKEVKLEEVYFEKNSIYCTTLLAISGILPTWGMELKRQLFGDQ